MRRLRVLTWHVHGNYLWYLSRAPHELFVPVKPGRPERYIGRGTSFPFPRNVHEVQAEDVRRTSFDLVLFQARENWLQDQHEILSPEQRRLPRIYLEHDPPREHPTDTRHAVDDPNVLLVHVTPFNDLMWDSGRTPTRVIEHGVVVPDDVRYTGELERGIAVVNHLRRRGRRVGADLYERARRRVPIDLGGMASDEAGGLGEVPPPELPAFEARYRFFFHPIRYTSLGLAACEAMMLGMPVVAPATTEMSTAIEDGVSGFVDTDAERLIDAMQALLREPELARRLGSAARERALERFHIDRFVADWSAAFSDVTGSSRRGRVA